MSTMDGFEQRLRHGLRDATGDVVPRAGLGDRVRAARRAHVRRRRAGRAAAGAGLAAALVVGVIALPGGSGPGGSGVAAAAERTTGSSFRFETVLRLGDGEALRAEGEVAAGAESARLVTTTALPAAEEVGGEGPLEVLLDRGRLYASLGAVVPAELRPEGAEWLVLDLEGGGYSDRLAASLLERVGDLDPTRALDALEDVTDGVVEDGEEVVRGAATTRYRFRVRLDDGDGAGDAVAGQAWVDGDGRLRRLRLAEGRETATVDLFDFGVAVDIDAPPRADTTSLDELLREGLGRIGGPDGEGAGG